MPPLLYLVRHAEGEHNINDASHILDATLTELGKAQCLRLKNESTMHNVTSVVMSSPLRRAIQTAVLAFGPTLSRPEVPFEIVPNAQEVSGLTCNIGYPRDELEQEILKLFSNQDVRFDLQKLDYSQVETGWNSKEGFWAPESEAVKRRAATLRISLFQRPEPHILLVTHGAFLHYLTEDWTGNDSKRGTAYHNCEMRQFTFTPGSSAQEAHIIETDASKVTRGKDETEVDPDVLSEIQSNEGHA